MRKKPLTLTQSREASLPESRRGDCYLDSGSRNGECYSALAGGNSKWKAGMPETAWDFSRAYAGGSGLQK